MAGTALLARLRRSPGQRLVIALFAVPAILIGLLAMHVLTADGMSDTSASVVMPTHHMGTAPTDMEQAIPVSPAMPALPEGCGGPCGPDHDMLGMICVLALLVTVVLLTLHLVMIRWEELRRVITTLAAKAATLAPPTPPSLHVLSISQT